VTVATDLLNRNVPLEDVQYNPSQVWRILRKLNWSCQRAGGRWSAMSSRSGAGSRWNGRALKKSPPRAARERVCR
jgi:hypothetical protein